MIIDSVILGGNCGFLLTLQSDDKYICKGICGCMQQNMKSPIITLYVVCLGSELSKIHHKAGSALSLLKLNSFIFILPNACLHDIMQCELHPVTGFKVPTLIGKQLNN